jgi:hypothetical protein
MLSWFQTRAGLDPNIAEGQFSGFAEHLPIVLFSMTQQFLDSTHALTLEANSPVPTPRIIGCQFAHQWANQVGRLQEYRYDLAGRISALVSTLDENELEGRTLSRFVGPVGDFFFGSQPNVSPLPIFQPYSETQYFRGVWDELLNWNCAIRVAVRQVLATFELLFGYVVECISLIRKPTDPTLRFFCGVCWEKRQWFLHHGSHPPRLTVLAIPGLFARACL